MTDITEHHDLEHEPRLVSYRTADIAVAALFLVASAIVITDSVRLGFQWKPAEGPAPGYFPFYIAVVMAISSAINLARAVVSTVGKDESMTTRPGFMRMMAIFIPAVIYAFAMPWIGIYISSALYIAAFMIVFGKFPVWKALAVAAAFTAISFMMFEIWFLVPLPKGPVEDALGF